MHHVLPIAARGKERKLRSQRTGTSRKKRKKGRSHTLGWIMIKKEKGERGLSPITAGRKEKKRGSPIK